MAKITKPSISTASRAAKTKVKKEVTEGKRAQFWSQPLRANFSKGELDEGETKKGKKLGRPSTKAHKSRALYLKVRTVGQFRESGGDMGYLRVDSKSGLIKVG